MTPRYAPSAASLSLLCLVVTGCASVNDPAYPVAMDRGFGPAIDADGRLAGTRIGEPVAAPVPLALAKARAGVPPADDASPGPVAVASTSAASAAASGASGSLTGGAIPALLRADAPASSVGGGAAVGILDSGRTLTLYASDDAFRADYETDGGRFNMPDARLSGGFLLSEERDNIFTGTVMLDTFPGLVPDVRLSIGARTYVALLGVENRDVFGLGIGVQGAYELPVDALPLQLGTEFFYTPDVLAFGQSDRIVDWNIDVGLAVRDNISAFVGFRVLHFDTRPGDRDVEDDLHVGVRWAFADGSDEPAVAAAPPPRLR